MSTDEAMHQPNGTFLGCGIGIGPLALLVRPGVKHNTIRVELLPRRWRKVNLEVSILTGLVNQVLGRQ